MRTITYTIQCFIFIFVFVFTSIDTLAGNDHEREALYRLLQELRYLNTVVVSAKLTEKNEGTRRFDYERLENELTAIETGISDYLHRERRDPRTLDPIQGSYTHGR